MQDDETMRVAVAPPGGWRRPPMTPAQFDHARRRFEELYPGASQTSGRRTRTRNQLLGLRLGSHERGMEADYVFDQAFELEEECLVYVVCKTLGLQSEFHDAGSGMHLHIQAPT